MEKFTVNSLVVDINEEYPPRKVVMNYCEHCHKQIKGLLGTNDGVVIFLTEYNKKLYKPVCDVI